MIDSKEKCENYRDARGARMGGGWHSIELAPPDSKQWKQKTATIGGNRCETVKVIGKPTPGYVDKLGFHPHT